MIQPSLNDIMKKTDCRYTLVTTIAKRARQIVDDPSKSIDISLKPVTAAVDDLMHDRITYKRVNENLK